MKKALLYEAPIVAWAPGLRPKTYATCNQGTKADVSAVFARCLPNMGLYNKHLGGCEPLIDSSQASAAWGMKATSHMKLQRLKLLVQPPAYHNKVATHRLVSQPKATVSLAGLESSSCAGACKVPQARRPCCKAVDNLHASQGLMTKSADAAKVWCLSIALTFVGWQKI